MTATVREASRPLLTHPESEILLARLVDEPLSAQPAVTGVQSPEVTVRG